MAQLPPHAWLPRLPSHRSNARVCPPPARAGLTTTWPTPQRCRRHRRPLRRVRTTFPSTRTTTYGRTVRFEDESALPRRASPSHAHVCALGRDLRSKWSSNLCRHVDARILTWWRARRARPSADDADGPHAPTCHRARVPTAHACALRRCRPLLRWHPSLRHFDARDQSPLRRARLDAPCAGGAAEGHLSPSTARCPEASCTRARAEALHPGVDALRRTHTRLHLLLRPPPTSQGAHGPGGCSHSANR